jgi:hypothetical protein
MIKCITVLAGLLRYLSRSDFEKVVNKYHVDKGGMDYASSCCFASSKSGINAV